MSAHREHAAGESHREIVAEAEDRVVPAIGDEGQRAREIGMLRRHEPRRELGVDVEVGRRGIRGALRIWKGHRIVPPLAARQPIAAEMGLCEAQISSTMEPMTRAVPMGHAAQQFRVSFVCTGNICRSPMAEVVLRSLADDAGLSTRIAIESAATGDWHVGEPADLRTIEALARAGYDGTKHRARQFDAADFPNLDLVVAFDRGQARILRNWAGSTTEQQKVRLLLEFSGDPSEPAGRPRPLLLRRGDVRSSSWHD